MDEFFCESCEKTFTRDKYASHLKRKIPCKKIVKDVIEEIEETPTIKTGINRILTDKFYTNDKVANDCISWFFNEFNESREDLFIEPSAGSGSFSDILQNFNVELLCYDIDPKKDYIKKADFLKLDISEIREYKKKIHIIGNPPFGRQSSLARKFIKKCSDFSDTISFILPKSFRKESFKCSFSLNFHLIKEYDIGKNAFTIDGKIHHVPCIFQIWEKKDYNRIIQVKQTEKGFTFVGKPELIIETVDDNNYPTKKRNKFINDPDFAILRAGGGKTCGRISRDWYDGIACYPEAWLFIKLNETYDKELFYTEYQKLDWVDDSNVGTRSISKPVFIKGINNLLISF